MPSAPLRLVVFDMAGTTVDDPGVVNRCFRETLAAHGLAAEPEAVDAVMGLPKPEAFRALVARHPDGHALADRLGAMHSAFVTRMVTHYQTDPAVREVPGVGAMFGRLRRAGIKVGIDTGFSREIADAIFERLGWKVGAGADGLIDASVTSDEVEHGRPAPDMIFALMKSLGVTDARAVAKVGDAPADLDEGMAARCRWVVGVTWGTHTRAQLERHAYTHLVETVDELETLLLSGAGPTSS
jgi:phosphonatase-like hydrolase